MGNTPTKESRPRSSSLSPYGSLPAASSSRHSRRRTLLSLGLSSRPTKVEDKLKNKEKHYRNLVVRYKENVDGGFLAPHGIYKLNLDFDTEVVRSLIVDRRLAPFYTPLQDFDPSWTEDEIVTLVRQLPLRALDAAYEDEEETEDLDDHKIHRSLNYYKRQEQKRQHQEMLNRIKEEQQRCEAEYLDVRSSGLPDANVASKDLVLKLYRDASECPICFLYFPAPLNYSRCCRQPICTECFVQIRRLDPHPPHDDTSQNNGGELPHTLISEYANCPYCAMNNFGVTYSPPVDVRVGLSATMKPSEYKEKASIEVIPEDGNAVESTDEADVLGSPSKSSHTVNIHKPRRRSSVAAESDLVITTDRIRPDWEQKLSAAVNRLARKAATASAIYASNLIVENDNNNNSRNAREQNRAYLASLEERMLAEAMRLLLLEEEQRTERAQRSAGTGTSECD